MTRGLLRATAVIPEGEGGRGRVRERGRERETETERQRQRDTEGHTDRQTDRDREGIKVSIGEENSPAVPARNRTRYLPITSPALYH